MGGRISYHFDAEKRAQGVEDIPEAQNQDHR